MFGLRMSLKKWRLFEAINLSNVQGNSLNDSSEEIT